MSVVRTVQGVADTVSGTIYRNLTGTTTTRTRIVRSEKLTDVVPAEKDKAFLVEKVYVTGGIADGTGSAGQFKNWPVEGINSDPYFHLGTPGVQSDSYYATKVAAETNPSEPLVDVGQTFAELREIPLALRHKGLSIIQRFLAERKSLKRSGNLLTGVAADLNLRFNFEIKPVVKDLLDLIMIRRKLRQRCRDLLRSEQKGGLVKKRVVFTGSATQVTATNRLLVSAYGTANQFRATVETSTRRTIWVYCRWVPDGTRKLPYRKDKFFHRTFGDVAFGLSIFNMRNLWNVLPWTWLVDWCFNVGDYLSATNNTVGLRLAAVCVCETTITEQRYRFTDAPKGVKVDDCTRVFITKRRTPTTLEIYPRIPLLSRRQVGILASIARTKGGRG